MFPPLVYNPQPKSCLFPHFNCPLRGLISLVRFRIKLEPGLEALPSLTLAGMKNGRKGQGSTDSMRRVLSLPRT